MTLTADYQVFLSTANPELLAKDAQLHYVSTLTSFKEPATIVKHLSSQGKALRKKQEKIISSVESSDAVALDVDTTIEFVSGGGAYLPGLDDNLLADRVVSLPILHIVRYDASGKIQQIRQQWDQASLLRAVEVIGTRGRNWPIKDGQEQIKLIMKSTEAVPSTGDDIAKKLDSTSLGASGTRNVHPTNDPHTTLSLFTPHEEAERTSREESVAPRGMRRPPTRDWDELFPSGQPDVSRSRSASPNKADDTAIAPKAGSGKNFAPSRLFNTEGVEPVAAGSPPKSTAHPNKYKHFEFYDGHNESAPTPSQPRPKTKHQSQWDFSDFTTPAKVKQRQHAQSNAQFQIADSDDTPMAKKPAAHKANKEHETHFVLQDDGERPADNRPRHFRGHGSSSVSHDMYTDHTLPENSHYAVDKNEVFRDIKNVSHKDRGKDFAPHFAMEDDPNTEPRGGHGRDTVSTSAGSNLKDRSKDFDPHFDMSEVQPGLGERSANCMNRPINTNRQKAVNTMTSQWEPTDLSPANSKARRQDQDDDLGPLGTTKGKENRGINIGGDGMGGRKDQQRNFLAEDEPVRNKGIKLGGDGMGGRSGSGRSWAIGDDNGDQPKPVPKKQGAAHKSDLWDF